MSDDLVWVDTFKDHLKSQKLTSRKMTMLSNAGGRECGGELQQASNLIYCINAKDVCQNFIDYIKMCMVADIPLERTDKRPGLCSCRCSAGVDQHYAQVGALSGVDQQELMTTYIQRLICILQPLIRSWSNRSISELQLIAGCQSWS